ncbi:MAG: hypothetical protein JXQ75_22430 [Phycisphaerae bacterium]|nr:hypothetical protein [Phycisphaerae bacterium]
MHVSEYYKLKRKQPSLDFVDVDIRQDVRVFIDPRALKLLPSDWGQHCVALIQSFFKTVLQAIKKRDDKLGLYLLGRLREPNETHLGLSRGKSRGRALGPQSARDVWRALRKSQAAASGLLEDLEDTILMVEGISNDIISDIATNIIRAPLIEYTQNACTRYGMEMEQDVDSGPLWDPEEKKWRSGYVSLPVTREGKLILVPKVIVRRKLEYDEQEYFRSYILTYLVQEELNANTELVHLLKSGKRKVYKKEVVKKHGSGKTLAIETTLRNPDILREYRADKTRRPTPPLSHWQLAGAHVGEEPDWDVLLNQVISLPQGKDSADVYEDSVEQLLTALFYPSLADPTVQHRIHDGRKRIDITYINLAIGGFFGWLAKHYPAPHVFVECKNYSGKVGNPELDQLSGRFSPSRGIVGLLVYRNLDDKDAFMRRCRDTAHDQRGFVLPIDDDDLRALAEARKSDDQHLEFELLKAKFDFLIM